MSISFDWKWKLLVGRSKELAELTRTAFEHGFALRYHEGHNEVRSEV